MADLFSLFRSRLALAVSILAPVLTFTVVSGAAIAEAQTLPLTSRFKLWDDGDQVHLLRVLLIRHGSLESSKLDAGKYDLALMESVRTFQRSKGLKPTGIARRQTIVELNKPPRAAVEAVPTGPAQATATESAARSDSPKADSTTPAPVAVPPAPTENAAKSDPPKVDSTTPAPIAVPRPDARPASATPRSTPGPVMIPTPRPDKAGSPAAPVSPRAEERPRLPEAAARSASTGNTAGATIPMLHTKSLEQMTAAALHYREIVTAGGWSSLAATAQFEPGQTQEMIPALRARLLTERYLGKDQAAGDIYDSGLASALRHFQRNHGFDERDAIDRRTLAALNVSAATRLGQIESSLDRLTHGGFVGSIPTKEPYVVLNIPARVVELVENSQVAASRLAIVGRPSTRSPELSGVIHGVTLNPTWTVPYSIVRKEIAPALRRNPGYLERHRMRVERGGSAVDSTTVNWKNRANLVRQRPGPGNSLGLLRIDMPNRHSVYFHDTPRRKLFDSSNRYYSHGCARVQDVVGFAELLLRQTDPALTKETLISEINAHDGGWQPGRTIKLKRPIRVFWVYETAWVTEDGSVAFRKDTYKRDKLPAPARLVNNLGRAAR